MAAFQIALINESAVLSMDKFLEASAAIQKQVTNDFGAAWGIDATVDAFASLNSKPLEAWPVVLRDDVTIDSAGAHSSEDGRRAFAIVAYREEDWTLTLSHEVMEMLVDPFGKTLRSGPSPTTPGATVEYLVEVCDPCQFAHLVGSPYIINGVQVSDFILPSYYKSFGTGNYSFTGAVTEPRSVLPFGYVTYHDPVSLDWKQLSDDGSGPAERSLGPNPAPNQVHLRGTIDRATEARFAKLRRYPKSAARTGTQETRKRKSRAVKAVETRSQRYQDAQNAQAEWWRTEIAIKLGTGGR